MRGAFVRLWPFHSVRWQVILPFAGLVVLTSAVGAYVVTGLLQGSLETRFVGHLVESSRVAAESLVRRERAHLELTRAIVYTNGVPEALRASPERLEGLVLPLAANTGLERVELVDTRGMVRYGVVRSATGGASYQQIASDVRAFAALDRVLAGSEDDKGDKHVELMELDGESWIITVAPILEGTRLRGAVLVGTRMSTALTAARAQAFADVTAFGLDGHMLASTSTARMEDATGSSLAAATGSITELALGERSYRELHSELVLRGEAVGSLATALPADFLADAVDGARWRLSALLFVGLLCTLVVGTRVARQLTGGLERLVETSRSVAAGDLSARSELHRGDEIGELSVAFDRMTQVLHDQHLGAVASLVSAMDARDPYTRGHSLRVGHLAAMLGLRMGLSAAQQHHLQVGGYLHDIGKIGIRDEVLLKPGALDDDERARIQQHPTIGHEILAAVGLEPEVLTGVVFHHERLDGSGYPLGLSGDEVPLMPRVIMVADVYDALVTDRPYRAGMTREEALRIIELDVAYGRMDESAVRAMREVAPQWDALWRQEARLSGFDLERVALDPALFSRKAA